MPHSRFPCSHPGPSAERHRGQENQNGSSSELGYTPGASAVKVKKGIRVHKRKSHGNSVLKRKRNRDGPSNSHGAINVASVPPPCQDTGHKFPLCGFTPNPTRPVVPRRDLGLPNPPTK